MPEPSGTDDEILAVFREPRFRRYLASRFFAGTAMMLLRTAVSWHVYDLTQSPFQLGMIGLTQFLPVLPLSLFAGAVADVVDRRRLLLIAQLVPLLCSLSLCLATLSGSIRLPGLYAAIALAAIASVFESPARASILPQLVPRALFPRAVTVSSTAVWLAFATGPMLMGFTAAKGGIASVYALHALLIAGSLASLLALPPLGAATSARVSWAAIREGLLFVWHSPVVLGCMTLDMFAVILGGATALLPIYARDILAVGELGYGVLSASLELGALAMSAALIFLPGFRRTGRALLVAVAVYGLATIVFGLSRYFPLSVLAYMVAGMADAVSVVLRGTAIQLSTPDALRGRVSSVNFIFIGASNQLGAAESGFLAAATSATFAVVSGGVGCLLVVALVAWRMPALRSHRTGDA
ncbi:MAG: MFS transporter [Deltaproteobacteria bacterium]|nr:MFS transporter [Deltaproteobacteria bacterium]